MAESRARETPPLFGVSAEFATADALLDGVNEMCRRKLGRVDAFSPVPVAGMQEALGLRTPYIRPFALAGVLLGFSACMAMCVYATGYAYVFDIGGRPAVSWASYVVPSFSFSLMASAILTVFGMISLNRLPRLNHPAFNIPDFGRASQDRFFLVVEAQHDRSDAIDPGVIERALRELPRPPLAMARVPR